MRIIAGIARGRKFDVIKSDEVRPTADRVREALFSHLGMRLQDANVLDLFGGSGALGMESVSRGAAHVTFVERSKQVHAFLNKNIAKLGFESQTTIHCMDADVFLRSLSSTHTQFDLIFLDPPYDGPHMKRALNTIGQLRCLTDDGIIVAEHREGTMILDDAFTIIRTKRYGNTTITTLKLFKDES